jgi:ABC-2 type transport system permease protein
VRLALVHARLTLLVYGRHPAFAVPTLLLPTLFFALFGLPDHRVPRPVVTASFAAYSVLTVVFFQFGVGIAGERESAWDSYQRTLPVRLRARFAGRVVAALVFATAGCGLLLAVAAAAGYAELTPTEWLRFVVALAAGAVPLSLLGIALGYWTPAKAALPVTNVLYLLIAYGGGLWTGPRLPSPAAAVAPLLPTRQWANILWPAVEGRAWSATSWLALAGFALAFAALAAWGYRRDEGRRYR